MPEYYITKNFSNYGSRNDVRMRVVNEFSLEECGKGQGDLAARYTYYVEKLDDGNRIYLRRPANLYNGFDFLVCVENKNFAVSKMRYRNYPKHDDIVIDLKKKVVDVHKYKKLFILLQKTYDCIDVTQEEITELHNYNDGFSNELLIKTIKWLFIEQDIRYWNYSGRNMLWSCIPRL